VEGLSEDTVLQGGQMSFITFRMVPTGTQFQMTPEIMEWVNRVTEAVKVSSSRFTSLVQ
jgi:hypothetical protein